MAVKMVLIIMYLTGKALCTATCIANIYLTTETEVLILISMEKAPSHDWRVAPAVAVTYER